MGAALQHSVGGRCSRRGQEGELSVTGVPFLPAEARLPVFVNADLIAAGLSPFNPELVAIRAGRLMLQEIDAHAAAERSFAFETTLAGLSYVRRIDGWRKDGYVVELIFSLPTAEDAIRRVAERVKQ